MRSVTELDNFLMAAGFIFVRQSRHRIWRCPCGHMQFTSQSSPCQGRGDKNMIAKAKRIMRECEALNDQPTREAAPDRRATARRHRHLPEAA